MTTQNSPAATAESARGILGEINSYDDLHRIMRARAAELRLSREMIDAISGLPVGYTAKLLSPRPIKRLGNLSMPLIFQSLGMKLIAVADDKSVPGHAEYMQSKHMRSGAITITLSRRFMRQIGAKGGTVKNARRIKRIESARNAALARWSKPRVVEVKSAALKKQLQKLGNGSGNG